MLIIAGKLDLLISQLKNPINMIEYVYYYYSQYLLGTAETSAIVKEFYLFKSYNGERS